MLHCAALTLLGSALATATGTVPGSTLQALIDGAVAQGAASLVVPAAEYDFATTASSLTIDSAVGLAIHGSGSTLWFAPGGGAHVRNCTRVALSSFVIDYTPTLAQGTVVAVNATTAPSFVVDFDARFLLPAQFAPGAKLKVAFFDPATRRMLRQEALPAAINIFTDTASISAVPCPAPPPPQQLQQLPQLPQLPQQQQQKRQQQQQQQQQKQQQKRCFRVAVTGNLLNGWHLARAGQPVAVFPRGGPHALELTQSARCRLDDVSIFGAASMAVVEGGGAGGHAYTRLVLDRRPLQRATNMSALPLLPADTGAGRPFRLLSSNADGFHSTTNDFAPSLVDSRLAWTGDDLANICSAMSVALTAVTVNASGGGSGGGGGGGGGGGSALAMLDTGGNLLRAAAGDKLSFYHLNTLQLQGTATVVRAEQTQDAAAVAAMRAGFAVMQAAPFRAGFVPSLAGRFARGLPVALTLQGGVPPFVEEYASVAILRSTDNSNALVRNTTLSDAYARILMVKGRDFLVTNSTFRRGGGVWVGPEQPWLEGDPGMRNVTIEGNTFDAIGEPPVNAKSTFNESGRSILVRNNTQL